MDDRQTALVLARGRAVIGLVCLLLPGVLGRLWLGRGAATPVGRTLLRMLGARDLVLGVGAITTVKEATSGPEWLGMGAVADGVDAIAVLLTPGLPRRARVTVLVAAPAAVGGIVLAKRLAAQREQEAAAAAAAAGAETVA